MLADEVDAVIGGDTHRDSHALEMAAPNGGTIGTLAIGNDETGYADAIAWITQNSPGPRVVVGLEGTRSYGVGLTRALQAAGFLVLEVE
jgi:transposase